MQPIAAVTLSWPLTAIILTAILVCFMLIAGVMDGRQKRRVAKLTAGQEGELRELVQRYEQLAESIVTAQQQLAAEVSEVRARAATIELILRSVDG